MSGEAGGDRSFAVVGAMFCERPSKFSKRSIISAGGSFYSPATGRTVVATAPAPATEKYVMLTMVFGLSLGTL